MSSEVSDLQSQASMLADKGEFESAVELVTGFNAQVFITTSDTYTAD